MSKMTSDDWSISFSQCISNTSFIYHWPFVQNFYLCYNTGKFLVGGAYHGRVGPQEPHLTLVLVINFPMISEGRKEAKRATLN